MHQISLKKLSRLAVGGLVISTLGACSSSVGSRAASLSSSLSSGTANKGQAPKLAAAVMSGSCDLNHIQAGCWIDLTTFLNSEYDYTNAITGVRYTQSSNIQSARNIGPSAAFNSTGSMITSSVGPSGYSSSNFSGASLPDYWASVKMGYFQSAQYPDVIFFSKMQMPGYLPEIFRYDKSSLNSVYVMSEPRFAPNAWAGYWQNPGASVTFADRGYYWNPTFCPVPSIGGGMWRSTVEVNGLSGGLLYNFGGYKSPLITTDPSDPTNASLDRAGYWIQQPVFENRVTVSQVAYSDYIPAGTVDWYNYQPVGVLADAAGPGMLKTGNLPPDLNVLVMTTEGRDATGVATWMERYFYGVRTNGDAFGMIGYEGFDLDSSLCGAGWQPQVAGVVCWGQSYRTLAVQFNHLKRDGEYTTYVDSQLGSYTLSTNADFYDAELAGLAGEAHDPKWVVRTPNTLLAVSDTYRPHLRGAFAAPGSGGDYNFHLLSPGQVIGLESNNLVDDFYLYAAGTDTLANPATQCRTDYTYRGGLVVDEVWSGLDRSVTSAHTWAVFCSTSPSDLYIGGATCASGYVTRGYFYSNYQSYVSDGPSLPFRLQAPGNWLNLCVKSSQALLTSDLGSP